MVPESDARPADLQRRRRRGVSQPFHRSELRIDGRWWQRDGDAWALSLSPLTSSTAMASSACAADILAGSCHDAWCVSEKATSIWFGGCPLASVAPMDMDTLGRHSSGRARAKADTAACSARSCSAETPWSTATCTVRDALGEWRLLMMDMPLRSLLRATRRLPSLSTNHVVRTLTGQGGGHEGGRAMQPSQLLLPRRAAPRLTLQDDERRVRRDAADLDAVADVEGRDDEDEDERVDDALDGGAEREAEACGGAGRRGCWGGAERGATAPASPRISDESGTKTELKLTW